ncbi:MAG: hypothetical protein M3Q54_02250 [Actinomycetota bacterium]|nr:hypothetical protein [Actinomycetota bacterium]
MKPLPDTSNWQPKRNNQVALRQTFLQTCRSIEARIRAESDIERKFNINNFDAGPGIEDIVREQIRVLLPDRYAVTSGVIMDSKGDNCGDCDLVVANRFWVPLLKYGATNASRRIHIPVEAVYTVIEVKQTLTESSLDDAMEKLVMYKGLERDRSEYGRLVENQELRDLDNPNASLNYRFDVVLAIGCTTGEDVSLIERFFKINRQLDPSLQVNALAILGSGFAFYSVEAPDGTHWEHLYPQSDMRHTYGWTPKQAKPFYLRTERDTLYHLYTNLWQHLNRTVLNFKWFKVKYGRDDADRTEYPINLD